MAGEKILASVVVPAFNEEKLIGRCLSALKNQDFKGKNKIIVVDNNSTDKTAQIAKKMGVKVITERKQGYVFALRRGCAEARGKYIAITDADSEAPEDWLKNIYNAFEDNPEVVCVGGGTILKNKNWMAFLVEIVYNAVAPFSKAFPGYNLAFRRDAYEKIGGYREEVNFDADVDVCYRLMKEGKLLFLKDNKVATSSRRFKHPGAMAYNLKGAINILWLSLFKKTLFFEFGDVRE
jgi:glycosyltransferase involved in cell wall biosynthesis